ncbi:MAG: response regulator transcription factor [Chitinophagales bacterium]|nr:response regulator transcription factor [Chitinophagales bacterium]
MIKKENHKILLIDDEQDIMDFLKYNLEAEGYAVKTSSEGVQGIKLASEWIPDVIVLDVMLPGMDGVEICYELRKIQKLQKSAIVFLSARGEDYSMIAGLEAGADDYLTKPIKIKVFLAKIKALLRREREEEVKIHSIGGIELNRERYILIKNGIEIKMPRKEFELLALLLSKPGKVFKRNEILDKIWGEDSNIGDRTIDVHIKKIRNKLNNDMLETVKGVGYKINAV